MLREYISIGGVIFMFYTIVSLFGMQYITSSNPPQWSSWFDIGSALIYIIAAVFGFLGASQYARPVFLRRSLLFFGVAMIFFVLKTLRDWIISLIATPSITTFILSTPIFFFFNIFLTTACLYLLRVTRGNLTMNNVLEALGVFISAVITSMLYNKLLIDYSSLRFFGIPLFINDGLLFTNGYMLLRLGNKINPFERYFLLAGLFLFLVEYAFPSLSQSFLKLIYLTSGLLFSLSIIKLYFDTIPTPQPLA